MDRRFSPCRGVCSATALGDPVCAGCGRTEEEVLTWNQMTEAERLVVWERIEAQSERL